MVTFNHPAYLILGICLIPGFLLVSALVRRFQNNALGRFGRRETLNRFSRFIPKTRSSLLLSLSLAALTLAAAEPSLSSHENGNTRTLNAVIVMDVSRSMLTEDGPAGASRLETGIAAVEKLLEAYPDGRFGLVIYTSQVFVYSPTFDHAALVTILRDILENYAIRGEGSDPIAALNDTAKLIEELPYTVNTVFVVSDGGKSLSAGTSPPPLAGVMKRLRDQGVRLVAAGIGGLVPAAIPVYAENGQLTGYHRYEGMIVYTALDEIPLKRFADETSGAYLHLTDTDALVEITQRQNLDSQPIAQDSNANLVWLAAAVSILLVALWLNPRS